MLKPVILVLLETLTPVLSIIVSSLLGVDIKILSNALKKSNAKDKKSETLSNAFDTVAVKLEESKQVIEEAMQQVEEQRKLVQQMKEEAEISQRISEMNAEQLEALSKVMDKSFAKNEKESRPRNFRTNLFFCVLGAVLGLILSRIFA